MTKKIVSSEVSHNADHPFEQEAVELLRGYVAGTTWSLDRLPISVEFGFTQTDFASHNVKGVKVIDGACSGPVQVYLNSLYLMQNPGVFLREVVAHEFVHLLINTESIRSGEKYKPHGEEYTQRYITLFDKEPKSHSQMMEYFDERPIKLMGPHKPGKCQCKRDNGFQCLSLTLARQASQGQYVCEHCNARVAQTGEDAIPEQILAQMEFIRDEGVSR